MPRLDKRLLTEVAETILEGRSALFLTPSTLGETTVRQEVADRVADRFRKAFIEAAQMHRNCAEVTARKLLRPEMNNPSFVKMAGRETGWVFFHPNEDVVHADEDFAAPNYVYWPTEGADYQKFSYLSWRRERRLNVWRPVHLEGALAWEDPPGEVAARGPKDAWAALLEDVF